jgi:hypothetical protein
MALRLGPSFLVLKPFTLEGYRVFMKPGTLHLPGSRHQVFSLPSTRRQVPGVLITPTPKYPYLACRVGVFQGWGRGSLSQPQGYPCQSLPTTDCNGDDAWQGQKDMMTLTCPASLCPCNCICCVAVPLMAACTTSLCSFCWLTPALCLYVSFFFFLLTPPFAVQSLFSHHHPCRQTSGCPPPQEPTTVQPPTTMTMAQWMMMCGNNVECYAYPPNFLFYFSHFDLRLIYLIYSWLERQVD